MAIATVTIELCPEDRKRLDDILTALTNAGTPYPAPAEEKPATKQPDPQPVETAQPDPRPEKAPEIPPVETAQPDPQPEKAPEIPPVETAQPGPQPEKAPEIPPVDRKEVQNAVVKLVAEGKKTETRKIVKSYANSVTEIPEDKLAEVLNALTALGDKL